MPELPHQVAHRRARRSILVGLALLAGGCAGKQAAPPLYPPAPDQPRFAFETVLSRPRDLEPDTAAARIAALGGVDPLAANVFLKPLDVAARNGRVYVSDSLGKVIHVFDAARGRYFRLGFRREGQLAKPGGVATDAEGNVYVADPARQCVVVFDALGLYLRTVGKGSLKRPIGIAVSPAGDRVYAIEADADSNDSHGVVAFDRDGNAVFSRLGRGVDRGMFNLPVGAAVGRDGTLYVLDAGNFRIVKLSPQGDVLGEWGGVGNRPGQLARPRDIATDRDGNVYVSDSAFGTIQIFDPEGRLLMDMGQFGLAGQPGEFAMLAGIGIDETGRVYAVDQMMRSITVFRPVATRTP